MNFQKNDTVTVTIEDMGSDGQGIGRADGFTLFVKDAVVGDTVEARIVKNKKTYAYARTEKVLTPSPFRVEPKCSFHRQCGGCQLQVLSYEKQLEFKQDKIRNNLIRIGGFSPEDIDRCMEPIVGTKQPFRYRNKAQYPVGTDRDGNVIAGFYAGRTHSIVANTDCILGPEENREILEIILNHMRKHRISAYDETTGEGLVRHILIRKGFTGSEIMVCLVLNKKMTDASFKEAGRQKEGDKYNPYTYNLRPHEWIAGQEELLRRLSHVEGMTSVSVNCNAERTNVILGKEVVTIWGCPAITDTIHVRDMNRPDFPFTDRELSFSISPLSFYQVNPVQTEKLYSLALQYAELTGQETVWDLYCGIGTISLFLAGSARKVCGVEIVPQAIEDARENARRNGIANAEFFLGKAEEVLPEFYAGGESNGTEENRENGDNGHGNNRRGSREMCHPDVIVVDPPRKGCDEACLATMLKMQPERIVYISCDSATLARDLKILCAGGQYRIERLRGVDMFPQGVHVETVVLMSRVEGK